ASGRVSVDGREVKQIAENDWVSVESDLAATLRGEDGTTVKLEAGSNGLLRKRGANLFNGAGTFTVSSGTDLYVLQTPAGTLNSQGGEFDIRLQPACASNGPPDTGNCAALALSVNVRAGSAQIDSDGKTT